MRIIAIGFCAIALFPAFAGAQESQQIPASEPASQSAAAEPTAQSATAGRSTEAAAVGPTIESARVGFQVATDENAELNAAQVRRRPGQDVALMVVGVGAMVVGAIVGGDAGTIILIGGAAIALWGLYNYLE